MNSLIFGKGCQVWLVEGIALKILKFFVSKYTFLRSN